MSWKYCNINPDKNTVGDCVVRAIAVAMNSDWDTTYVGLTAQGYLMKNMPSANAVWGAYLHKNGFRRHAVKNTYMCPDCYKIQDFCRDNPYGIYILATGTHVVTVIDGDYYDTWDSGNEVPEYYWQKEVF